MLGRRVSSLGVDIGSSFIKIVELEYGARGPVIVDAGMSEPLSDDSIESIGNALAGLIARKKFRSKRTVMAVSSASGELVTMRPVFLEHVTADTKKSELRERVEQEAATQEQIPYSADEVIMDFHVLGEATQGSIPGLQIFLVAVHREFLKERLDMLKEIGLVPIAVDTDFSALLGLLGYMDVFPDDEDAAVIDIGATKTFIGIVHHRQPAFYREVPIAGNHITSQIERRRRIERQQAEEFKLTEELFERIEDGAGEIWRAVSSIEPIIEERQGLYRQLDECFRYYEGDFPNADLAKILFSGGTSQLRNLDRFLSQRLAIPVENVSFLNNITVADAGDVSEIEGNESTFATAVGLALKPFRKL